MPKLLASTLRLRRGLRRTAITAGLLALVFGGAPAGAQTAVVTHHFDISRDGWNPAETVLTPANVGTPGSAGTFGLLHTVPLDGHVDAQPLVMPGIHVSGERHRDKDDIVYVATQNNTIYAIDAANGDVLLSRNFGLPVQQERGCGHTDFGIGITGTPVIDLHGPSLYLVAYTSDPVGGGKFKPVYRLHELNLSTLADKVPPVVIAAEQTLNDGSTLVFNPAIQRQRPALLLWENKVYVAFSTFCDGARARGWVMGYWAPMLRPLEPDASSPPFAALVNRLKTSPSSRFITSIWMSNAGPAADGSGLYYVTGNSDPSGTTYDPVYNAEHSVVRLSLDTTTVLDRFTPSNLVALDANDLDFGAGGVILLPRLGEGQPQMAAAAGKFGTLYLLSRANLGGYTPGGPDNVLASAVIGPCWCAPSYFNDGTPTLVSSGGNGLMLWQMQAHPTPALSLRAPAVALSSGQDPGFFTSVSSNGANDTIVWAVSRPVQRKNNNVYLYAYGVNAPGTPMTQLFVGQAGTWIDQAHNSNLVPVIANGHVYVANDSGLEVFGLAPATN